MNTLLKTMESLVEMCHSLIPLVSTLQEEIVDIRSAVTELRDQKEDLESMVGYLLASKIRDSLRNKRGSSPQEILSKINSEQEEYHAILSIVRFFQDLK